MDSDFRSVEEESFHLVSRPFGGRETLSFFVQLSRFRTGFHFPFLFNFHDSVRTCSTSVPVATVILDRPRTCSTSVIRDAPPFSISVILDPRTRDAPPLLGP